MIIVDVEFNYECPFHFEQNYQYSEYTSGTESKCTRLGDDADCCGLAEKRCPLKENGILVQKKIGD